MTTPNGGGTLKCAQPIDPAILADYWVGSMAEADEEAIEQHLFECDYCGDRLRRLIVLADGIRKLAREGSLRMVVSDLFLQRATESGLTVREYKVPAGGSVECTVTADDDILIGRVAADLSGAKRVDMSICNENGVEQLRLPDIPVHPGRTSVAFQESITFMKSAPSLKMIVRLVSFNDTGNEQVLGEYTFNHTRSMPGPGAW
ncbi:MAG TPA: hypothetical protein VFO86_05225 [Terriglobia bacterium]|nr:hypothetical protein [Terriglobia bacterium]